MDFPTLVRTKEATGFESAFVQRNPGILSSIESPTRTIHTLCGAVDVDAASMLDGALDVHIAYVDTTEGVDLHHADVASFSLQIVGSKEWLFLSPMYDWVYRPVLNDGWADYDHHRGDVDAIFANPLTPHSRVVTQPGDTLYFPPMWTHAVLNRAGLAANDTLTIGLTVRQTNGWLIVSQGLAQDPFYLGYTAVLRGHDLLRKALGSKLHCDWSRFWTSTGWCDDHIQGGTK